MFRLIEICFIMRCMHIVPDLHIFKHNFYLLCLVYLIQTDYLLFNLFTLKFSQA